MNPETTAATEVPCPGGLLTPPAKPRILALCSVDIMAWLLLRPWFQAMQDAGYEVHIACAQGEYFERLAARGFCMHAVSFSRTFTPWAHIRPFFQVWRLVRQGGFQVVNAHSPIAAAVGRLAARLGGCGLVVYTVHGFYFHENMPALLRRLFIAVEWLIGRFTDHFMFVSDEDHRTAVKLGIASKRARTITLLNGVDLRTFAPREAHLERANCLKREHGITDGAPVIGIVGRIVREKGYREFLDMAARVIQKRKAVFLVVGDTLPSDRDQFGSEFRREIERTGLSPHFILAGQTDRVADYLRIMDIFVLPSYREGFPRSVVEAMSTGLPAVVTNIRGCREAVQHGITGLIVAPKDGKALFDAVDYLLDHPEEAAGMGAAARQRAVELYDYRIVQQRFVTFVGMIVHEKQATEQGRACGQESL